ncbi:Redox-sensitive transcriptional regulator [Chitinispirillum alkaliphilum]|nr:Redox-sensitive transcriptional regulator [Chitinispirillum alkaliphilum]
MSHSIPLPAVSRLCSLYQILGDLESKGVSRLSSGALGEMLGVGAPNLRKDISYLGESTSVGGGYEISRLRELISRKLGLNSGRKTCIAGLGRLGSAIMQHCRTEREFDIKAGFDSNINLIETMSAPVAVFPSYEMVDVIRGKGIELGILTVPASGAQECAENMVKGGIRGIINFTPVVLRMPQEILVRNIDLTGEFRALSALMFLNRQSNV